MNVSRTKLKWLIAGSTCAIALLLGANYEPEASVSNKAAPLVNTNGAQPFKFQKQSTQISIQVGKRPASSSESKTETAFSDEAEMIPAGSNENPGHFDAVFEEIVHEGRISVSEKPAFEKILKRLEAQIPRAHLGDRIWVKNFLLSHLPAPAEAIDPGSINPEPINPQGVENSNFSFPANPYEGFRSEAPAASVDEVDSSLNRYLANTSSVVASN